MYVCMYVRMYVCMYVCMWYLGTWTLRVLFPYPKPCILFRFRGLGVFFGHRRLLKINSAEILGRSVKKGMGFGSWV